MNFFKNRMNIQSQQFQKTNQFNVEAFCDYLNVALAKA